MWYIINIVENVSGGEDLEPLEMARKMVEAASDKQASDIVVMDTREVCPFADYFVICSGDTERQLNAIRGAIDEGMKREGVIPHHCEGTIDSGWMLLDFGDVIAHIFSPAERDYYQLEHLWSEAALVVRVQ